MLNAESMEASGKLPWWAGLPLSAGLAVMGIFAPTFLPEWTQAVCFAIAATSVAWGICAAFWHYRFQWGKRMFDSFLVLLLGVVTIGGGGFLIRAGILGVRGKMAIDPKKDGLLATSEPLVIWATLTMADYPPGSIVGGITWVKGYSHVNLGINNPNTQDLADLDATVEMDRPILKAITHSQFNDCKIGQVEPTVRITNMHYDDGLGNKTAIPSNKENAITLTHSRRILCQNMTAQSTIDVDFATIRPPVFEVGQPFISPVRDDPTSAVVTARYIVNGQHKESKHRITLSSGGLINGHK